jgi:UDP-GlcNAc3NAcA epimerase
LTALSGRHSILKIANIVGARPQFVKAAVVTRVLKTASQIQELLIHTGQHYDENMSDVFFRDLEIPKPDYHLGIGSKNHGAQTGQMLESIEQTLLAIVPDLVLVYGDTNSTLAGALAAVKLHIPVGHVEAGLRSYNRQMPEEINRVLTDHASDLLFAPTEASMKSLKQEGIPDKRVFLVGDVMYDASIYYGCKAEQESRILQELGLQSKQYILATIHRAENTDDFQRLRNIFQGLDFMAKEIPVVIPLHPRTREALKPLLKELSSHVAITQPVGYLDMIMLEKHSRLIATDSGGVQKEAFFYHVPCVTLRSETEWVELVELGWNRLVQPLSPTVVFEGVMDSLDRFGSSACPYGDGHAAEKILDGIRANWSEFLQ